MISRCAQKEWQAHFYHDPASKPLSNMPLADLVDLLMRGLTLLESCQQAPPFRCCGAIWLVWLWKIQQRCNLILGVGESRRPGGGRT